MGARRSISMVLVWLCAVAGGLLCFSAPALAQRLHAFNSSFGSEGTEPGQFKQPGALAVNDETGDVYVIDRGNARVEVFDAAGTYLSEFNGGATPAKDFGWKSEGRGVGSIAVDNSTSLSDPSRGDVYVVDADHSVVDKFTAGGVYIGQVALPAGQHPVSVAVDASGALWGEASTSEFHGLNGAAGSIGSTQGADTFVDEFSDASDNALVREVVPTAPENHGTGRYGGAGVMGLAVDSEGNVYEGYCPNYPACSEQQSFFNPAEELLSLQIAAKFVSSGGLVSDEFDGEYATALALDDSSNDLYVDNRSSIAAFSPAGSPIERFGSPQLGSGVEEIGPTPYGVGSEGIAVNAATGTVYASDAVNQAVFVFTAFVVPDVSTGAVSNLGETSATVNGVVNPDGLLVESCVFEYGTTSSYGQEANCSVAPGSGSAPVAVGANLSGLERLTTYHFRLKVSNVNGTNVGQDATFLTPEPVGVSEEEVSDVSSTSALFSALVDPSGSETTFHFEYGPTVGYGESLPVPDGELGVGVSGVPVSVRPEDLLAGTTYHVRLVASNALGVVYGPDEVFTTQAAGVVFALPDGREWEMVSPPAKYGAGIEPLGGGGLGGESFVEAAEDGGVISYTANGSIVPNPAGNPYPQIPAQVLSRRGAGGWSTGEIALPRGNETIGDDLTSEYRLFSSDLSSALVEPITTKFDRQLSPEATLGTPYLRDNETGSYLPLVTANNVPAGTPPYDGIVVDQPHVLAATPDLSHVLLQSPYALAEKAKAVSHVDTEQNLYEWSGGRLQLVNVLPGGEAAASGFVGGITTEGEEPEPCDIRHAVSNDGSRVFWQEIGERHRAHGPLYMRDTVTGQTVQVDAPASGVPSPPQFNAQFQVASADGSKVFFTEEEPLTSDSKLPPSTGEPDGANDLYVYDTVTGTLTDLTGGGGASGSEPGDVQGEVLGASEEGNIVYFVASAVLAEGAQAGQANLYVASAAGSGWSERLVAVLSGEDSDDWAPDEESGYSESGMTSRVSPNGRFVAFMSDRSLTGYDNRDLNSGVPDEEVFLYDEATGGHVVCASCNPTGERPTGILDKPHSSKITGRPLADLTSMWPSRWLAALIPGWTTLRVSRERPYQQRYLSDEGRLFFDGFDALAAEATNGKANVYEYEPSGVGSCAQAGGCVGLISSGTSSEESVFMDASESGDDVFFLTASALVPQDVDDALDVYDAHVCSAAAPCVSVPVSPPACSSGDACKAAPSPQPAVFGAPASATFSGAGNLPPASTVPVGKGAKKHQAKRRPGKPRRGRGHSRKRGVKSSARRGRVRRAGR